MTRRLNALLILASQTPRLIASKLLLRFEPAEVAPTASSAQSVPTKLVTLLAPLARTRIRQEVLVVCQTPISDPILGVNVSTANAVI